MLVSPRLDPGSLLSLSLPLVVFALATGHVQGIGLLLNQAYRPPVLVMTSVIGLSSVVNALFGGHQATVQTSGTAIVGGSEAGPHDQRYVAAGIAGIGCLVLACFAAAASGLVGVLPASLVTTLAGLAVLCMLMDAIERTMTSDPRMGSFLAAASPLTIFGIGAALWALVGGFAASLAVARQALLVRLDVMKRSSALLHP